MGSYLADIRATMRRLARTPGFLAAAGLTLAIGIGANAVVFAFIDAMLLRPQPFGEHSDRIVAINTVRAGAELEGDDPSVSAPDLEDLRRQSEAFADIGVFIERNLAITGVDGSERVLGTSASPNLLAILNVTPMLGRPFAAGDAAEPGFEQVLLLGYDLWQRRFGGDPEIVGKQVPLNARSLTVAGVMPPGFRFPERSDVWLPYAPPRDARRSGRNLSALGLLQDGVDLARARSEAARISAVLEQEYPDTNRDWEFGVMMFRDSLVDAAARPIATTMAIAVAFVLAIACANIANLLLSRGLARRHELSIRAAIGARRAQLMRLALAESAILAFVGGVFGVLLAAWAVDLILASFPEELPYWMPVRMDGRVLLFTVAVSTLTTLLVGLWPAWRMSRPNLVEGLKETGHGSTSARGYHRMQKGLAVVQIALCLALLVGANMMIRSFVALLDADSGFDESGLLTSRIYIAGDQYDPPQARAALLTRLADELRLLPGVTAAAATTAIPIDDSGAPARVVIDGMDVRDGGIGAQVIASTAGLFATLNLDLIAGRPFTNNEVADPDAGVTILSRSLAERLWGTPSAAVERDFVFGGSENADRLRVVGVAPDIQYDEFGEETEQSRLNVYLPWARSSARTAGVLVRAEGDLRPLASSINDVLRRLDPAIPAYDVRTMRELREYTNWEQRFFGRMMGIFAVVALFLACLGVYALVNAAVSRRSTEIAIRVALGARTSDVVNMVFREMGMTAVAGIAAGLLLAAIAAQLLTGVVYEAVQPDDPAMFALMAGLLLAVTVTASVIPARRAARRDPMKALRL